MVQIQVNIENSLVFLSKCHDRDDDVVYVTKPSCFISVKSIQQKCIK